MTFQGHSYQKGERFCWGCKKMHMEFHKGKNGIGLWCDVCGSRMRFKRRNRGNSKEHYYPVSDEKRY